MVTDQKPGTKSDAKRLSHVSIFGPSPLLAGEDAAAYDELLLHVTTSVRPSDILDEIWVRDIVDLGNSPLAPAQNVSDSRRDTALSEDERRLVMQTKILSGWISLWRNGAQKLSAITGCSKISGIRRKNIR
jgi:hypothetical protein